MDKNLKEKNSVKKIISFIGSKNVIYGSNRNSIIRGFNPIDEAKKGELTYCTRVGEEGKRLVSSSKASLIICNSRLKPILKTKKPNLIFVTNPRLWFIKCLQKFFSNQQKFHGIDSHAKVMTNKIGKNVYIGPFSYIDRNVLIGNNTIIHSNVVIFENTTIGNNVNIDPGTVIGTDGFGFERNKIGKLEKFPHSGGVLIEDDVEIGANVCIDKGTMKNTVIGNGSKIDNLVHIAHNVKIGKNCIVVANSLVAGSCIIEDNAHIAMSATIREKIRIGKNAFIGMGSVVTKNVKKNSTVMGVPAREKL